MAELFATRDRKGKLRAFTSPDVVKNNGAGYWIPTYNSGCREIVLDESDFPEISWDDSSPTKLLLVNPQANETNMERIAVPGTIKVNCPMASDHNMPTSAPITVFVDDISYIEPRENLSVLHMKRGDNIVCAESASAVEKLIVDMKHENR
jgi:hypothetical protein